MRVCQEAGAVRVANLGRHVGLSFGLGLPSGLYGHMR